jgi:hypothetical protein
MKKLFAILASLALGLAAQANIIQFDLSPAGSDAATGLSPLNQVPANTNSSGSGNEISGGISFNTDTLVLTLAVGYGSSAGFTDLTAPTTAMHIHGPAGPGTNAGVVVSLAPYLFTQGDTTAGGIIFGQVPVPTNAVDNLLAGLTYINIHTTNFPGGEIRGQLIPLINNPPVVACPAPSVVECGGATVLAAQVSDPEGDALTVVWWVNGVAMKTNELAAGSTAGPVQSLFTAEFPLGTNAVAVVVTDTAGNSADCATTLTVVDTIPPMITAAAASPNSLWPPNHKMVAIRVAASVVDVCSATTWKIISVTSSEAVDGPGSGNTSPDWEITGDHTVKLRAERSGITGPRIYTITIEATDAAGNVSQPKTVTVTVPHSRGRR